MAKGSSRMHGQNLFPKDDDNKFFSRLLSREGYNSSKQADSSFRVLYYAGAAGSVPFLWESQPGTPKHTFNNNPPPPLTPPPYYQSSPPASHKKNSKNSKIMNSIFQKNPSKKFNNAKSPSNSPHSSSSSSSSFSSSYSLPSTPVRARKNNNTKARSGSTVRLERDEDEYEAEEYSPSSTLCFGPRSGNPSRRMKGYYYPIKSVKKVVLSIVGHGTAN